MNFRSIRMTGFRMYRSREFTFADGLNVFVGPNESGKTALHQAIVTALYGVRNKDAGLLPNRAATQSWGADKPGTLELTFEDDGEVFRVCRDLDTGSLKLFRLEGDAALLVDENTDHVEAFLRERTGIENAYVFNRTISVGQADLTEVHNLEAIGENIESVFQGRGAVSPQEAAEFLDRQIRRALRMRGRESRPGKLDQHETRLRDLGTQIEEAEQRERRRQELEDQVRRLDARLPELERRVGELDGLLEKAESRRQIEDELRSAQERFEELDRDIRRIEEQDRRIDSLERQKETLSLPSGLAANELETRLSELGRRADDLGRQWTEHHQDFQAAQHFAGELDKLRPRLKSLTALRRRQVPLLLAGVAALVIPSYLVLTGALALPWLALALLGVVGLIAWAVRSFSAAGKRRELENLSARLQGRLGLDERTAPDETLRRARRWLAELQEAQIPLDDRQARLAREQKELLSACACSDTAQLRQKLGLLRSLEEDLRGARAAREALLKANPTETAQTDRTEQAAKIASGEARLTGDLAGFEPTTEEVERWRTERDESHRVHLAARDEWVDRRAQLRMLNEQTETPLADLLGERDYLTGEIAAGESVLRACDLARDILAQIQTEHHALYLPFLRRLSSEYFQRLTRRHYEAVELDDWPTITVRGERSGLPPDALSQGTLDQLFFALRLAAGAALSGKTALPLILDDPFASFDPERTEAAMRLLADLARDGKQVLFFTHDPGVKTDVAAWQAEGLPVSCVELKA